VGKVRSLFNAEKAGHGGTLDPLACGLLPIALGEATKTVSHAMDGRKVYRFTARWGEERPRTISRAGVSPPQTAVPPGSDRGNPSRFTGEIMPGSARPFRPSRSLANGAYDLARAGRGGRTWRAPAIRIDGPAAL